MTLIAEGIEIDPAWLEPTWFLDSDSPEIAAFWVSTVGSVDDPTEMAVRLFCAVRDGIRYDPYGAGYGREDDRASAVSRAPTAWCVPKSALLTAAARNRSIPARLGFADVRNHLASERLREAVGTDLFAWHGYSELLLDGGWRKLSTAFNIELCERFGVQALAFDGTGDALMRAFNRARNRHMAYVRHRDSHDDLPLDQILSDFAEIYPQMVFGGSVGGAEGNTVFYD